MFSYKEAYHTGDVYRRAYLDGIDALIDAKRKASVFARSEYRKDIFTNPEKYRNDFRAMLGWPLTEKYTGAPKAERIFVAESDGVKIYRVTIWILDCVPFYGMLFLSDENERKPLVIACHGGGGTPELVSGIVPDGSANYNDMVHRVLKQGCNVYAPQLLLWNPAIYPVTDPVDEDHFASMRNEKDVNLKQLGSSVTAIELHGIERAIDWLQVQTFVDPERIGMVGLSYGGFYTLFAAAVETRIKASVSSCFFSDRLRFGWADWAWMNSGNTFTDEETLALVYPRPICLQVAARDQLFGIEYAQETYEKFRAFAGEYGSYASLMVFDGTHEFSWDDAPINDMMRILSE